MSASLGSSSSDGFAGDMFGNISDDLESSDSAVEEDDCSMLDYTTESGVSAFVLAAVLAGLYELPPDWLLRKQSGLGRRVRYDRYSLIRPTWTSLSPVPGFDAFERALVPSRCPHSGVWRQFGMYQLELSSELASSLNLGLTQLVWSLRS